MGPIKFRAWDKEKKEMYVPVITENGKSAVVWYGNEIHGENDDYIMQFTGVYDCKGKEIFEGDLLINRGDKDAIFECFYHDGNARFSIARSHYRNGRCGGFVPDITAPYLEVIGTIHENPDLLEKK
jgi:hypothetical protein